MIKRFIRFIATKMLNFTGTGPKVHVSCNCACEENTVSDADLEALEALGDRAIQESDLPPVNRYEATKMLKTSAANTVESEAGKLMQTGRAYLDEDNHKALVNERLNYLKTNKLKASLKDVDIKSEHELDKMLRDNEGKLIDSKLGIVSVKSAVLGKTDIEIDESKL